MLCIKVSQGISTLRRSKREKEKITLIIGDSGEVDEDYLRDAIFYFIRNAANRGSEFRFSERIFTLSNQKMGRLLTNTSNEQNCEPMVSLENEYF